MRYHQPLCKKFPEYTLSFNIGEFLQSRNMVRGFTLEPPTILSVYCLLKKSTFCTRKYRDSNLGMLNEYSDRVGKPDSSDGITQTVSTLQAGGDDT